VTIKFKILGVKINNALSGINATKTVRACYKLMSRKLNKNMKYSKIRHLAWENKLTSNHWTCIKFRVAVFYRQKLISKPLQEHPLITLRNPLDSKVNTQIRYKSGNSLKQVQVIAFILEIGKILRLNVWSKMAWMYKIIQSTIVILAKLRTLIIPLTH